MQEKSHVKPYHTDGGKKEQVTKMFDNIAKHYDLLNRVLSLGIDQQWRKKMIRLLASENPSKVLDVATGTGDVALAIAKNTNAQSIVGLDISKEMLAKGKEKVLQKNLADKIEMIVGDSENLPFEEDTFDAITVAFGVRNFETLEKGLSEMNRVLKPNGKAFILEFSQPKVFPFKQIYHFYFKNILPNIGKLTSKDPRAYKYLFESVQAFPDGKDFVAVMEKTGYKFNKCVPLTLGVCSIYIGQK